MVHSDPGLCSLFSSKTVHHKRSFVGVAAEGNFLWVVHEVAEGQIGSFFERGFVPAMDVRKVLRLHEQPDSFYGIEVRRIGGKIERFEETPLELLSFMPCGVVENENVPFPGRSY